MADTCNSGSISLPLALACPISATHLTSLFVYSLIAIIIYIHHKDTTFKWYMCSFQTMYQRVTIFATHPHCLYQHQYYISLTSQQSFQSVYLLLKTLSLNSKSELFGSFWHKPRFCRFIKKKVSTDEWSNNSERVTHADLPRKQVPK